MDFNYGDGWNYKNEGGWDVEISSGNKQRVTLLGPAKRVDPQTGAVSEGWHEISGVGSILRQRYDRYMYYVEMRRDIGEYGPVQVRGNPGFTGKGPQTYWNFKWPVDFFKNCRISLGYTGQDYGHTGSRSRGSVVTRPGAVRIVGSSADGVLQLENFSWVNASGQPVAGPPSNGVSRCVIWGWMIGVQLTAYDPDMIARFTFQGLRPRTYYLPMANAWVSWSQRKPRLGFAPYPQVWDDDREYEGTTRKWTYGGEGDDAVPVRTSKGGRMDVYFKSGSTARFERPVDKHGNCVVGMTFLRPEVMELLNISPRAISLKNWTLTFNTGTMANDIGSIDTALGYGPPGGSSSTPIIEGNSYFYLVNNAKLFNIEHGSGAPVSWGRGAGQRIPAWEIPTTAWGVQFRIKDALSTGDNSDQETVNKMRFTFENERFGRENQFKGEVFEVLSLDRPEERQSRLHGSRYVVSASGRNWIEFRGDRIGWQRSSFRPPNLDTLMIIGMPAKGGLVSMTLKNEYKQIVARAVEYAYLDSEPLAWMGSSAEKIDPSHNTWVVRQTPTLGGMPAQARNYAMRSAGRAVAQVKNGPYVSVGEVHRVRSARDFEDLGAGRRGGRQRDALATLASVFGASALRLEACDERAVHTGWQQAQHTVSAHQLGSISTRDAAWEVDQWRMHTVRFMTGALRGEMFPIVGNTRNAVQVSMPHDAMTVRSTPGCKPLQPAIGDVFTIGPGYASGLCYARRPEQQGEWTWRQRIGVPGNYHLYIFGLNDSISTTEFLEENDNAALDVAVWNYAQAQYDTLARQQRYGKDDGIYAGRISPEHVSASGDFRLRLTAHGVGERGVAREVVQGVTAQQRRQSGYAWFNYAMLTPVPVPGRVNANTANPRLLASLPGITPALAHDIFHGIDSGGRATLKPYTTVGDLVNVRGMTAEIFERSANMFCLDSRAYTMGVHAQTVKDTNADGIFDERQERVQGERHKRLVVRTGMGTTMACTVDTLEQYSP